MWRVILILIIGFAGFWVGTTYKPQKKAPRPASEKEFPITEHKSFVIVVYAHNQDLWCERTLQSIFEQEYDHYRVIFLDDGSIDRTFEKAKEFTCKNNQEEKIALIRNETGLGKDACVEKAKEACLEKEILVLLDGCNWLSSPLALAKLNQAYQNPEIKVVKSRAIHYPSYEMEDAKFYSSYAGLDQDLADGQIKNLQEPIAFYNDAAPMQLE